MNSLQLQILVLLLLVFCLKVRDQEFPYRRNLARVIVNVEDVNDHSPYFTNPLMKHLCLNRCSGISCTAGDGSGQRQRGKCRTHAYHRSR